MRVYKMRITDQWPKRLASNASPRTGNSFCVKRTTLSSFHWSIFELLIHNFYGIWARASDCNSGNHRFIPINYFEINLKIYPLRFSYAKIFFEHIRTACGRLAHAKKERGKLFWFAQIFIYFFAQIFFI